MGGLLETFCRQLCSLENNCRREVFNVTYKAEKAVRIEVRKANALCRFLLLSLPPAQHRDLINAKNEEFKGLWKLTKCKVCRVLQLYLSLKHERQVIEEELKWGDCESIRHCLDSEWFEQFRPILFDQDLLRAEDPDLPFLPFHLPGSLAYSFRDILTGCNHFYNALDQIKQFERKIKHALATNEPISTSELQDVYRSLMEIQVENVPVLVCKWNLCVLASDALMSEKFRLKARMYQLQESQPREGNNAFPAFVSREELLIDSVECRNKTTECRGKGYFKGSGYWARAAYRLCKVLNQANAEVIFYYANALKNAQKYPKALALLEEALHLLDNREDSKPLQISCMQVMAQTYNQQAQIMANLKYSLSALSLAFSLDNNFEQIIEICSEVINVLTTLCLFEQAESLATLARKSLKHTHKICNSLGRLYTTQEKFAQGEEWLRKCLAQGYNSLAHINHAVLCLNMGRIEDTKRILRAFLGRPEPIELHRASAMTLMSRCCVWNQEFDKAKEWMQKAASYGEKWNLGSAERTRITYESGILSCELGEYVRAEEMLVTALDGYKSTNDIFLQIWASRKLAEVYLLTNKIPEAELTLSESLEMPEELKSMTIAAEVYRVQGRICLAKHEFTQAREWLQSAILIQERVLQSSKETAETYSAFGSLELEAGRNAEAYERFTQALQIMGARVCAAEAYSGLAEVYLRAEDWETAKTLMESELQLFKALPRHPLAIEVQRRLNILLIQHP